MSISSSVTHTHIHRKSLRLNFLILLPHSAGLFFDSRGAHHTYQLELILCGVE